MRNVQNYLSNLLFPDFVTKLVKYNFYQLASLDKTVFRVAFPTPNLKSLNYIKCILVIEALTGRRPGLSQIVVKYRFKEKKFIGSVLVTLDQIESLYFLYIFKNTLRYKIGRFLYARSHGSIAKLMKFRSHIKKGYKNDQKLVYIKLPYRPIINFLPTTRNILNWRFDIKVVIFFTTPLSIWKLRRFINLFIFK